MHPRFLWKIGSLKVIPDFEPSLPQITTVMIEFIHTIMRGFGHNLLKVKGFSMITSHSSALRDGSKSLSWTSYKTEPRSPGTKVTFDCLVQ